MSPTPFSVGKDQQYVAPGAVGTVLTSNGPGLNPSWQSADGVVETAVTGNYSIKPSDGIIQAKGPNSQVLTLPTSAQLIAAGVPPGKSWVINANGDGLPVTIQAQPGSNINRVPSFTLSTRFSVVTVYWDGFNFFISTAYLPAAEVILVDEFAVQFEIAWVSRRFPEAVYVQGSFPVLGIADLAIQQNMADPGYMAIYDAMTRRPFPEAVYAPAMSPLWVSSSIFM